MIVLPQEDNKADDLASDQAERNKAADALPTKVNDADDIVMDSDDEEVVVLPSFETKKKEKHNSRVGVDAGSRSRAFAGMDAPSELNRGSTRKASALCVRLSFISCLFLLEFCSSSVF